MFFGGTIINSAPPVCTSKEGHAMLISDSDEGNYGNGFECDQCGGLSKDEAFDGLKLHRWNCAECAVDFCVSCRPEFFIDAAEISLVEAKVNDLSSNLKELVDNIRDDDRAREYAMRRYRFCPRLLSILVTGDKESRDLALEAVWYFTRNPYAVTCVYKSQLLNYLVDELIEEKDIENLKKIMRSIYNVTLSTPGSLEASGLKALSLIPAFTSNIAIPLQFDDTELLTVCMDVLDSLSNSTEYFKSTLVYPNTSILQVLPSLLARGEGVASRAAYFMWVMVSVDDNKRAFCTGEAILSALKRIIDEDFDGARSNAFGTLWNLAALATNKIAICSPSLGMLPVLVRLIKEGDEATKVSALGVTSNLSVEVQNKPHLLNPNIALLPALVHQVRENDSTPRVTACQTLMNLAASEDGALEIIKTGVHHDMLMIIKNAPNDPGEWGGGSNEKVYSNTCIMNLAEWESNRPLLKADGAVEILGPLLTFNHFHSLTASMAYAFLVGRDEKGPQVEILRSGVVIIDRLIDLLDNTIGKTGGDGYQYGLFRMEVVVHACLELSLSDANKVKLATPRVRDLLLDVIKNALPGGDGIDLYNSESEVLKSACLAIETLLQMSFVFEDSAELVSSTGLYPTSCGLEKAVSEFAAYTNADLAGTPIGLLLSRLSSKSIVMTAEKSTCSATASRPPGQHIMISYSWNKKAKPELVAELSKSLRARGYEVWRDVEGSAYTPAMSGSTDEIMADAIEMSFAVVICVSKEYKQSPNCRMEANYCNQRSKKGTGRCLSQVYFADYKSLFEYRPAEDHLPDAAIRVHYGMLVMMINNPCYTVVTTIVLCLGERARVSRRVSRGHGR